MQKILSTFIEKIDIDSNALAEVFALFSVSYKGWSDSQRKEGFPILAKRIYQAGQVLSLVMDRQKQQYWVLLAKNNELNLADDSLAIQSVNFTHAPLWVQTALLIRALPHRLNQSQQKIKRTEADGLYYLMEAKKLDKGGQMITALNVDLNTFGPFNQQKLVVRTQTFTSLEAHRTNANTLPNKIARLPRYHSDRLGQVMVRTTDGDYVKRSVWKNSKNRIVAFSLSGNITLESYYQTKLGVLSLFLEDLQRAYGDHFKLQLRTITPTQKREIKKTAIDHSYKQILQAIRQQPLAITNHSDDEQAGNQLQSLLPNDIHANLTDNIQPEGLNILLVNNKEQYETDGPETGITDPYKIARSTHPYAVIQSCYPDSLNKNSSHVIAVLLKELLIKVEIQQRQLLIDYPPLPPEVLFITSVKPAGELTHPDSPWPMYYSRVNGHQLEFGQVSNELCNLIKEPLSPALHRMAFQGYERADLIFWPNNGDALVIADTGAVTLPDEPAIHSLVKEFDKTHHGGVPASCITDYLGRHPDTALKPQLLELLTHNPDSIPAAAFKTIKYRGKAAQQFYDELAQQGYRLKASLQAKHNGPLSVTSGIWIDHAAGLYSIGGADSAKRDQDNFNHIYTVQTNGPAVPYWFWESLEVWHVKHRGATVYPYIFKHLREYAQRQMENNHAVKAQE